MSIEKISVRNWIHILRVFWVLIPAIVVASTVFMVSFGEQGLLALLDTEERLAQVRLDALKVEQENIELQLQIRRIKSRPEQIELLSASSLKKVQEGTTVYRFSEEE